MNSKSRFLSWCLNILVLFGYLVFSINCYRPSFNSRYYDIEDSSQSPDYSGQPFYRNLEDVEVDAERDEEANIQSVKDSIDEEKLRDAQFYASLLPDQNQEILTEAILRSGNDVSTKMIEDVFQTEIEKKLRLENSNRGIVENVGGYWDEVTKKVTEFIREKMNSGKGGLFSVFWAVLNKQECKKDIKEVCFDGIHSDLGCFGKNLYHLCTDPQDPELLKPKYHLYNRPRRAVVSVSDDLTHDFEFIDQMTRRPGKKVAFILHGFDSNPEVREYIDIRKNLLKHPDYDSVIHLDYRSGVKGPDYIQAMVNSEVVGRFLGNTLVDLVFNKRRISLEQIHLIGFSMGTQVAHFAGEWFAKKTKGRKIGRITGLDPPGVLSTRYPRSHLNRNDSRFVDIIHSSAGFVDGAGAIRSFLSRRVGIADPIGHVDIYPNGGGDHPQCTFTEISCKHDQSLKYFIHSIHSCNYFTVSCKDIDVYENSLNSSCKDAGKVGPGTRMGLYSNHPNPGGVGIQFVSTVKESPHCLDNRMKT